MYILYLHDEHVTLRDTPLIEHKMDGQRRRLSHKHEDDHRPFFMLAYSRGKAGVETITIYRCRTHAFTLLQQVVDGVHGYKDNCVRESCPCRRERQHGGNGASGSDEDIKEIVLLAS